MTLIEKQTQFAQMAAELINWCNCFGYTVTLGEVYRTEEQQKLYVERGLSKTMNSKHRDRLAIDLNLIVDGKLATAEQYRPLGEKWERMGGKWGGNFKGFVDAPHFEWDDAAWEKRELPHPVSETYR